MNSVKHARRHARVVTRFFRLAFALSLYGGLLLALGIGFTGHPPSSIADESRERGEQPEAPEVPGAPEADDWFFQQRAYPLSTIPVGARARAIEEMEENERQRRQQRMSLLSHGEPMDTALLNEPAWQALGPQPITNGFTGGGSTVRRPTSGRATAIALDPGYNGTSNQTLYLGTAQGGVWRTRDHGTNWTPLIDDQPSLAVGALAIDPFNPNVIYVGTGEGNRSANCYYGAGLLKSTNGGASWTQITGPVSTTNPRLPAFLNASFSRIAIDRANTSTLYACTRVGSSASSTSLGTAAPLGQRGVWKSTDSGLTWRNLDPSNTGGNLEGTDVLIDPRNSNRVFAALFVDGLYRSTAGGEPGTWEKLAGGLPTTGIVRIALAAGPPLAPSTNTTFFAAIGGSDSQLQGIYRSTDNGNTWTRIEPPPSTNQTGYNLALAVDPTDANHLYCGTVEFFVSRDGGSTWVNQTLGDSAGGIHVDQHDIVIDPSNRDRIFVANDGGLFRSDQATAATIKWSSLNQGLSTVQFYSLALHPAHTDFLIGGAQDNGTNRFTGQPGWTNIGGGDGGFAWIDQANPSVIYWTAQRIANANGNVQFGPFISLDGGNTFAFRGCNLCPVQPGNLNINDRVGFLSPFVGHPGVTQPNGNVLYFGTHRLYRSADRGVTWTGLGPSADGFGADVTNVVGDTIAALAVHPKLDPSQNPPGETVWVGSAVGGLRVTTNAGALAGATFTSVAKAPLPNRFIADIASDPNDARRAVVTYSGFNTNTLATPGHVFLTTNLGASWTNISGNLPDIPVTSVALDPLAASTIYVGTDIGVFQTVDGGATWIPLLNGMPRVAVLMLRYHTATRTLVAATHGRGMYKLSPARAQTSVLAASFSPALTPEAIASAFGVGLATQVKIADSLPLPTSLAGTQVAVKDSAGVERLASLFFVAPGQINYLIPAGTALGIATVTIISSDGTASIGTAQIGSVAPGLFTANSGGTGVAAAIAVHGKLDGSQTSELIYNPNGTSRPIDLGPPGEIVVVLLYGTGIRNRSSLSAVTANLGGVSFALDAARFEFAGPAPGFVGLDQVNVQFPRSLIGRGEVNLVLTVDGVRANTVTVNIK